MRAYERLLNYVRVYTTSDPESGTHPSAEREFDLARQLVEEMKALGIEDARVDEHCRQIQALNAPLKQNTVGLTQRADGVFVVLLRFDLRSPAAPSCKLPRKSVS